MKIIANNIDKIDNMYEKILVLCNKCNSNEHINSQLQYYNTMNNNSNNDYNSNEHNINSYYER